MGGNDARKRETLHPLHGQGPAGAAAVLSGNAHLLPGTGQALDLACGRGGNALFLAGRGLETTAWDISGEAIAVLAGEARRRGLPVRAEERDVVAAPPPPAAFDVIVVSYFLERALAPAIAAALRPAGLLFYQTWIEEAVSGRGPRNPAYRLARNELLRLFAPLDVLVYREEGRTGEAGRGFRDEAMLVAMAPA